MYKKQQQQKTNKNGKTKETPFITALHVMQTRYSEENSVCPSVRLSVCPSHAWIVTKRKKDRSRFLYHMKEHLS